MDISIRKAKLKDTDAIVTLAEELGYKTTAKEVRSRLRRISVDEREEVYVAVYKDVIGWMHITLTEPLESKAFAEIRGIVVKKEFRGKGAGAKLIDTAVLWAKSKECKKLRIRTNIVRTDTRKYYRKRGFISKKTQEVFEKFVK
ncbi:MAG TPA: GNAT family N-acetyltransferase [Ignavibacteriaceae bacterium]